MVIDLQRYWGEKEIYFAGELSSKIIDMMRAHGNVTLRSKEPRNAEISGLFFLLDQLCNYWKWDKKKIVLETTNVFTTHPHYQIKVKFFNEPMAHIHDTEIEKVHWDNSKLYGMFIGRANVTRLRAIQLHRSFQYRDHGLTSFNHDVKQHIDARIIDEFLIETDCRPSDILDVKPYSDIGPVMTPPITGQFVQPSWADVYRQIPLEIICATGEVEKTASLDEKIIRPILYRRPFMVIGAQNLIRDYFKNFRNLMKNNEMYYADGTSIDYRDFENLRFFEHVIPLDYDRDHGIHRVDHVFDILRELIRSRKIYTILETCADDIEWNYQTIKAAFKNFRKNTPTDHLGLWDVSSWQRPKYD